MAIFSGIMMAIKSASLTMKIVVSVSAAVVVSGGIATTAVVINNVIQEQQKTEQQMVDDSPISQQPEQIDEEQDKKEETPVEKQPTQDLPAQTQPQDQESTSRPVSESEPVVPEPEPVPTADYNLNDKYVFNSQEYRMFSKDDFYDDRCYSRKNLDTTPLPIEIKNFYEIGKWDNTIYIGKIFIKHFNIPSKNVENDGFDAFYFIDGGTLMTESISEKVKKYANTHNYLYVDFSSTAPICYQTGAVPGISLDTWQAVIDNGYALDEAKCAQYGLSCARW